MIVEGRDAYHLEAKSELLDVVNDYLGKGWELWGGVSTMVVPGDFEFGPTVVYSQVMLLEEVKP